MVYVGTHFDKAMIDREHAEMLALGGINLAISQVTIDKTPTTKKMSKNEKAKIKSKDLQTFLERILPSINRWQVFELQKEIDGVDGEIKICITSEDGKININKVFDFKKQNFKPVYKTLLQKIKFRGKEKISGESFLNQLTELLIKRNRKLEDISQLQTGIPSKISKLFYNPPHRTIKQRDAKPNDDIAINDIFTIWSDSDKIQAPLLSDALCSILNFRRPMAYDAELRKKKFTSIIENFNPKMDQNNKKYLKIINPLYEPKSTFKLENTKIFSSTFEPRCYSVLSSGKVGNVEQKLLAIIKKTSIEPVKKNKPGSEKKATVDTSKNNYEFKILRLYWI
jgi:hypothetical protein